jgi:hypothetical protein
MEISMQMNMVFVLVIIASVTVKELINMKRIMG